MFFYKKKLFYSEEKRDDFLIKIMGCFEHENSYSRGPNTTWNSPN